MRIYINTPWECWDVDYDNVNFIIRPHGGNPNSVNKENSHTLYMSFVSAADKLHRIAEADLERLQNLMRLFLDSHLTCRWVEIVVKDSNIECVHIEE